MLLLVVVGEVHQNVELAARSLEQTAAELGRELRDGFFHDFLRNAGHTHAYVCTYLQKWIYSLIHTYIYVEIYTHIYICTCIYYIYICILWRLRPEQLPAYHFEVDLKHMIA